MVRQTARVIVLELIVGLVLLAAILVGALAIRLASGPIELGFLRDDVERAISRARDGRPVAIGSLSLEWLRSERRAIIAARDITFHDADNNLVAQASDAEILANARALFTGRVEPIGLSLSDGFIEIEYGPEGWIVAGEPIGDIRMGGSNPEGFEARRSLQSASDALGDLLSVLQSSAAESELQQVSIEAFDVRMADATSGWQGQLNDASGSVVRGADGLVLEVAGASDGVFGEPGQIRAAVNVTDGFDSLRADLQLQDWSMESVLGALRIDALSAENVNTNLAVQFDYSSDDGLTGVTAQLAAGDGLVNWAGRDIDVSEIAAKAAYNSAEDTLTIDANRLAAGPVAGRLSVEIEEVLAASDRKPFRAEMPELALDLTPIFSDVWSVRRLNGAGSLNLADRRINVDRLTLSTGDADLRATGRVDFLQDVAPGELPVEARLNAEMTGELSHEELLTFWPVRQGAGARNYVSNNVLSGTVTEMSASIDLKRNSRAEGYLADEAIEATFSAVDVGVTPLRDIPPILDASLTGKVTGNTMRLDFQGGRLALWKLDGGYVHYPQLSPPGADMTVSVSGSGPAQNMLRIVSDSRLQLQARSGFDPAAVSGEAEMTFSLTRPALPDVPVSEYRYQASGDIRAAGLEDAVAGFGLVDSDARLELDETAVRVFGFGTIAGIPAQYNWQYAFNSGGAPARLTASGIVTPDALNEMGIVGRAYLGGEFPIEVNAALDGSQLRSVNIEADLTSARLDVAEVGWIKPSGDPASARLQIGQSDDGGSAIRAEMTAEDAELEGDIVLEPSGRLVRADMDRALLKDRADLAGSATRGENNELIFDVRGAFLDLSRMIANVRQVGAGTSAASRIGDVLLQAEIDQLRLRDGFDMLQAKMDLVSSAEGLQTVEAVGITETGADFSAAYDASGLGDPAFRVTSEDASFLASVFLGFDSLEDGELEMTGTLGGGDLPTQIRVQIADGRLNDPPVLTQILSLASIRGLSDTLSGDGVLFTEIDIPLSIVGSRYRIVGGRASGPALGMTANGWVDTEARGIDVDGVLVPSFGVNSALGGIPIIGDLLVSRRGEGVFSLRYGVEGTLDRAEVSVNPLSAVTPGILRRIFEDPENEEIVESLPVEPERGAPGVTEDE